MDHEDASLMLGLSKASSKARTTTRQRPILFSGEMVRAILAGRKTQTRRVLGFQPLEILTPRSKTEKALKQVTRDWNGTRTWFSLTERGVTIADNHGVAFRCKYGEVGDRLWVRETWYDDLYLARVPENHGDLDSIYYRADGECCDQIAECCCDEVGKVRWRSPMRMPRWASRITLEITAIRVERVQQITARDAKAEGALLEEDGYHDPRDWFENKWDSLNEKRGYSWDSNPWVWVIEFRSV